MDLRLRRGVEEFNAGHFFHVHEIWEELWLETVGPPKLLLQGLVQIAAGYVKGESGGRSGAIKLLSRGVERVRQFCPSASGLALAPLVEGVEADLRRLRAATDDGVSLALVHVPGLRLT